MSTRTTPFEESFPGEAAKIGEKISDTATQVKEKISDFGQAAAEKINQNRDAAADQLENAATTLRENVGSLPGGERIARIAHSTADKLHTTADYVKDHDLNGMMGDVEAIVKRNPGPALLTAAVIGFLVGRIFTRND